MGKNLKCNNFKCSHGYTMQYEFSHITGRLFVSLTLEEKSLTLYLIKLKLSIFRDSAITLLVT